MLWYILLRIRCCFLLCLFQFCTTEPRDWLGRTSPKCQSIWNS